MLWEIFVPCQKNNGKPVTTRHHKEWDKRVRKITNGLTIMTPAKGQWIDVNGSIYEERMIPVRISCTEAQIKKIMDMTAQHYEQLAVMAYLVSDKVIIKDYTVIEKAEPSKKDEPEHVRMARFYAARVPQYGSIHVCQYGPNKDKGFHMATRTFAAVEVEWTTHFWFDSYEHAKEVVDLGIAKEWMNCIKDYKG